jgi:putative copper export protein/mono/diheme cytochrome c family protein/peroxiredoxin
MIELVAPPARFLHAVAGCVTLGLLVFEWIVAPTREGNRGSDQRLEAALVATGVFLGAGGAMFAAQLESVASAGLGHIATWSHYALSTRFGVTWLFQQSAAVVLLAALAARRRAVSRLGCRRYAGLAAMLAFLAVPASTVAGHGVGGETPVVGVAIHWLHVAAVGSWAGGLPALMALSWEAARDPSAATIRQVVTTWRRFSPLALMAMVCAVAAGGATAWLQVGGIPPLLGTAYGRRLLLKLAVVAGILLIAAHLRWRVLPILEDTLRAPGGARRLATWVAFELLLALGAIALGSALAGLPPAGHEPVVWPLSVRFAPDIAWLLPGAQGTVAAGALMALLGAAASLWLHWRAASVRYRALGAFFVLAGLALAVSSLTVPANPDTYRRSAVPYDVFSIANGQRLFRENCTICHGVNASGDGEAAGSTPRPPADLTAPHARDHTAGDMFWWISHGMPDGGMPGFSGALSEDERWDLVNFIHTLAAGYQARMIREWVAPRNPWLGAPDFALDTVEGGRIALQDFRRKQVVLLVLFSVPESEPRLRDLEDATALLYGAGATVIAIPINPEQEEALPESRLSGERSSQAQIADAYMLFRRTLSNQRWGETGPKPRHMEILVDPYGFIRARWVPEDGTPGWSDIGAIIAEVRSLLSEGRVRDPPDAHLH